MRLADLAVVFLAISGASAAHAADLPSKAPPAPLVVVEPEWKFQATFYLWATAMNGDTGVRGLPPASVDVTFSDVLDNLDGAVMGSFLAQKGDWTFLVDLIYADISDSASFGPLGGTTADLSLQQTIFQGMAGYKLPLGPPENVALSGTVGFRYQHLDADFDLSNAFLPIGASTGGSQDWVDPTVGLMLQYRIDDKWFINAIGDVGGFGVSSKITAQGFLAVGYMWTPSISSAIGYRAIYTDYEKDGFVYDVTQHGAFLSVAYHF